MRAWAFLLGGCLFVGIGVIGIFVPVLPTTPFLLLASFCFVRSSPRLNRWLMNHRVFGRYVRDWEEKRGVRPSVKVTAFTMMAVAAVATTVLAELPGWALVRAGDGTVGWVRGTLRPGARACVRACGPVGPAAAAGGLRRLTLRLRGHLGVPYRLGGTTRRHIDCSGLVQRCVREALGLVLPRHSTDQLARSVAAVSSLGEPGDLLFMAGLDAVHCHVGVVLRGPRPGARTLLHASSRRGRVVEEPLDGCLARASRVQHMELAQLLELR